MLKVKLLGQFNVQLGDDPVEIPSRAMQSLLAYLMLNAGTAQRREKLAGMFWPESTETRARSNLRHTLWQLRKALVTCPQTGREFLQSDDLTITFDSATSFWLDAAVLDQQFQDSLTTDSMIEAVSTYRGELLPGFYNDWVTLERERLQAVFEHRIGSLLKRLVEAGRWGEVLEWGERWIALGHTPEPAYRALMTAHGRLGDLSAVASVFQRCSEALRQELGVEPSPQTRELYGRLSNGEPPLPASALGLQIIDQAPAPGTSPYKGMHYYNEDEGELFFGRESLTAKLVARLTTTRATRDGGKRSRFLAVVGASGSGKSSVVRAGLIPAIKRGGPLFDGTVPPTGSTTWPVHVITPTAHPLEALAVSLTRGAESVTATATLMDDLARDPRSLHLYVRRLVQPPSRLLLVVDQLEELFTLCRVGAERRAFVDNLMAAVEGDGSTTVVVALRADFYAHCGQFPRLREALERCQVYMGTMSRDELRRAMIEPARLGGWTFEPGLVDMLLQEVGDEPGALPLLSHTLLETWRRRRGRTLTLSGYSESGGVRGAVAQTAEQVLHGLPPEKQVIARNIFLRLTALGEGTQDTRRRVAPSELVSHATEARAVEEVLLTLVDARLITTSKEEVEVAHEALIREWPTLRRWLDEDREGIRLHRQLGDAAQDWDALNRDPGALYRGARLERAGQWAGEHADRLNALEHAFLAASQKAVEERAAQRRRTTRIQRFTLAAIVLLILGVLTAIVVGQSQVAQEQRQAAQERQRAAETAEALRQSLERAEDAEPIALSRQLAAQSASQLDANQRTLALLLAIEAGRAADTVEALSALGRVFAPLEYTPVILAGHTGWVYQAAWNSDETQVLTASADDTARVWDVETGAALVTLAGHTADINQASWSPDESQLLTASADGTVRVWDAGTGAELLILPGHRAIWNADGRRVLTASADGTARVWQLTNPAGGDSRAADKGSTTGGDLATFRGHTASVLQAMWNADESRVLTTSADGTARVWDARMGAELLTLTGHTDDVYQAHWNADESRVLTASADGTARVWDAETGVELLTLSSHTGDVYQAHWNADESRVLTASADGTARVWNLSSSAGSVQTGAELLTLAGHTDKVWYAEWNGDESLILTASRDGTARIWDAETGARLVTFSGHTGWVFQAAWNADGSRVLTASADDTARVWTASSAPGDAPTRIELLTLIGHTGAVDGAAWNGAQSRILTTSEDGTARIWDVATGAELLTLSTSTDAITHAAWSRDGDRVLTAGYIRNVGFGGIVRVWDAETGDVLGTVARDQDVLADVAWNQDESRVLTACVDKTARVWRVPSSTGNAQTGDEQITLQHDAHVSLAVWGPDESHILTGATDGTVRVWVARTGFRRHTLSGHAKPITDAVWSADGSRILTASADGTARIWDAEKGEEILVLFGHSGGVNQAQWNSDESRILTASADGTARVWERETGAELLRLSGHTDVVWQAAWNADDSRILTASADNTVKVWDAGTGIELLAFPGQNAWWNINGSLILTTDEEGTLRLFSTRLEDLIEIACRKAPRNLTLEEWEQFKPDEEYRATCPSLSVPER